MSVFVSLICCVFGVAPDTIFGMDYCERCDDLGITRRVTDEIWCKAHYELWLLSSPDNPFAPADVDDLDEWIRLHELIAGRIALCSDLDRWECLEKRASDITATYLKYRREYITPLLS